MKKLTINKIISILVLTVLTFQLTSCGYILHPERRGQSRPNLGTAERVHIDHGVMLMDTALLLLGIIPGIIAYAVDFSTGCIYLSPDEISSIEDLRNNENWEIVRVDPNKLNQATIEKILREHTGKSIQLNSPDMLLFKPGDTNIDIVEELSNLQMGKDTISQGIWFSGSQVEFVENSTGRLVRIEVSSPTSTYLVLN